MKICCLSGYNGCGKSFAANILQEYGFKKVSFATPLKQLIELIFNEPLDKAKHRYALFLVGEYLKGKIEVKDFDTAFYDIYKANMKHVHEEIEYFLGINKAHDIAFSFGFWAKLLVRETESAIEDGRLSKDDSLVIDDLRFPEEQRVIKDYLPNAVFALIDTDIEMCKNNLIKRDGKFNDDFFNLPSETAHKNLKYNIILENKGSDFESLVRKFGMILLNSNDPRKVIGKIVGE